MGVRWLTPDDLAARWGIPKATLYQWRHRGEGPQATRFGRHLRFLESDVEAWEQLQRERDRHDQGRTTVAEPRPAKARARPRAAKKGRS
jgi:excisionase family DNA binding protein